MRGCFVTATDTAVGKTVVAAAIAAALTAAGERVAAYKPVLTGLDEPRPDGGYDHEILAAACGMEAEEVAPLRFGPAVSPHLAAQLAGAHIEPGKLVVTARRLAAGAYAIVVEGVGGLRVPLAGRYGVRELAADLGLPLVVAARPGLGTINHTLLTLESARAGGLRVAAVVLTPWPAEPGQLEASNRETLAHLGEVAVETLPPVAAPTTDALAAAASHLPLKSWLGP